MCREIGPGCQCGDGVRWGGYQWGGDVMRAAVRWVSLQPQMLGGLRLGLPGDGGMRLDGRCYVAPPKKIHRSRSA